MFYADYFLFWLRLHSGKRLARVASTNKVAYRGKVIDRFGYTYTLFHFDRTGSDKFKPRNQLSLILPIASSRPYATA